jgi:1-aminocyclopropane-1-carboxylate deaminase/D-cysteine desulfhydrase-like pyridoxal-dependent ACC family enzyme
MIPLFQHFPGLKEKLPYVNLCQLPTPVKKLDKLGKAIGLDHLYIKQDGLTAQPFGGNKIRKMEFLLGDVLNQGAREVMTFGFAGSNHALATALCAKKIGLTGISMLMPQHNADYVRRNLLMSNFANAELHQYPNKFFRSLGIKYQKFRHWLKKGKIPYIIPLGGSNPIGAAGFVNAAFELRNQIQQNVLPEPHLIYITLGTAGTAVGLKIGLKVLGLKSEIIPIRVVDHHITSPATVLELFSKTVELLHKADASFPAMDITGDEFVIRDQYLGNGYAQFTKEGSEAIALMKETEGIRLDGTYTGKTAAALIDDARNKKLTNQVVLFWNTLNEHDFSSIVEGMDFHHLPKSFHRYFESGVQPQD